MNKKEWQLAVGLGALALVRPLLSIVGIAEMLGKPVVSIGSTLVITIIWVWVASQKSEDPIKTLAATGITYGLLAIILSAILSPILTGQLQGPVLSIYGISSVLITNLIWGVVAGLLAKILQSARR